MRLIRKTALLLLAAIMLISGCTTAGAAEKNVKGYQVSEAGNDAFIELVDQLKASVETPSDGDGEKIDALVEKISACNADDGDIARAVAEHWKAVYLDPGYRLCIWWRREDAKELAATKPDYDEKHAFVVLGYQLKDGKMQNELIGRCKAAAAAAKSFPDAYLICSGGATGQNNPEYKTEAGLMKQFLAGRGKVDRARILIDTRALTTVANAENTFAILKENDIHSITLVTSTYHQKWAQVLYNAMAAIYEKLYGFKVRIVGNFCYDIEPESGSYKKGYRIALSQLSQMLGLKKKKK